MLNEDFFFFLCEKPDPAKTYNGFAGKEVVRGNRAMQVGHWHIGAWKRNYLRQLLAEANRTATNLHYILEGGN